MSPPCRIPLACRRHSESRWPGTLWVQRIVRLVATRRRPTRPSGIPLAGYPLGARIVRFLATRAARRLPLESRWLAQRIVRFLATRAARASLSNPAGLPSGSLGSLLEARCSLWTRGAFLVAWGVTIRWASPADTYARRYAGRKEPNDPPGKPAGFPAARGPWISNQTTGFRNTFGVIDLPKFDPFSQAGPTLRLKWTTEPAKLPLPCLGPIATIRPL